MPTTLPRLRSLFSPGARTVDPAAPTRRPGSAEGPTASPLAWVLLPFAFSPLIAVELYVGRLPEGSSHGTFVSALVPLAVVASFALSLAVAALASVDLVVTDEHVEVRFGPRTVRVALADIERCTVAPSTRRTRQVSPRFGLIELIYLADEDEQASPTERGRARMRRLLVRVESPFVRSREITLAARRARARTLEEAHPTRVVIAVQSRPTSRTVH